MSTLAESAYLDSSFDELFELPKAGSPLENPYVFDATARELKELANRGLIEIVGERVAGAGEDVLIHGLTFRRLT